MAAASRALVPPWRPWQRRPCRLSRRSGRSTEQQQADESAAADRPWVTVVWNDPVNLMSYVTHVLMKVFGYPKDKATKLMLDVHHKGRAVVSSPDRGSGWRATPPPCTATACGRPSSTIRERACERPTCCGWTWPRPSPACWPACWTTSRRMLAEPDHGRPGRSSGSTRTATPTTSRPRPSTGSWSRPTCRPAGPAGCSSCRAELPAGTGRISLDAEAADRWLRVLNDLRLALGPGSASPRTDELDPADPAVAIYHWLSAVQELLVRADGLTGWFG